jgi:hypothetical protein
MRGYVFDPALVARREADPTFDSYRAAGELLRDHLGGGDIFAEVRERARRDPRLRTMLYPAAEVIAPAREGSQPASRRRARRPRRPR